MLDALATIPPLKSGLMSDFFLTWVYEEAIYIFLQHILVTLIPMLGRTYLTGINQSNPLSIKMKERVNFLFMEHRFLLQYLATNLIDLMDSVSR